MRKNTADLHKIKLFDSSREKSSVKNCKIILKKTQENWGQHSRVRKHLPHSLIIWGSHFQVVSGSIQTNHMQRNSWIFHSCLDFRKEQITISYTTQNGSDLLYPHGF